MFPKKLPEQEGKKFWSNADCFGEDENMASAFCHKNYNIGMHSHEFYELNIVIAGKGCHYLEEMSMPIQVGDVFVIPPYVKHGYYCMEGLDVFHILVAERLITENYSILSKTPGFSALFEIEPYLRGVYDKKMFLHLQSKQMLGLMANLEELAEICGKKYFEVINVYALKLICGLCMKMDEFGEISDNSSFDADIIKVMEYIRSKPGDKHTVKELADIAGMTVPTFGRYFKKIVNMPPMEYVTMCRITLAKQMIAEGTYNKTEIAQQCGFYDLSHMDKYMKRSKGVYKGGVAQ